MNKKLKETAKIVFFFLLALAFIWWFVNKLSPQELKEMMDSFKNASYFWFILAVVINTFSHYIRALRWRLLIKPLGYDIGRFSTFFAIMSCYLTNLAVPRLGEIVRTTMVSSKNKIPFDKTFGTVITERAIDTLLFGLIFIVAFFCEYDIFKDYILSNLDIDTAKYTKLLVIACIGVALICILVLVFRKAVSKNSFFGKIKDFFVGILQGMKTVFQLEKPLLFIFYSVFIWFLWIFGTWVLFKAMQDTFNLNFMQALTVTVLGAIGPMITPGGIGIYPAIFSKVLEVYSIKKTVGYALGWLSWLVSQVSPILLGPCGFIIFAKRKKDKNYDTGD